MKNIRKNKSEKNWIKREKLNLSEEKYGERNGEDKILSKEDQGREKIRNTRYRNIRLEM
jgi:hypothetical protein